MVSKFEEELTRYEQEMKAHMDALKAKAAQFKSIQKRLSTIESRLEKDMQAYLDEYHAAQEMGLSIKELKDNNIDNLYTLMRKLNTTLNAKTDTHTDDTSVLDTAMSEQITGSGNHSPQDNNDHHEPSDDEYTNPHESNNY